MHQLCCKTRQPTLEAQLQTEREALERKEKEIHNLEEQLEQFREELENKSEEVQQLHMQLEIQRKEISSQQQYLETRESMLQVNGHPEMDERDELIKDLESQVECLRSEQERLKRKNEEELDQLNEVIEKLQQELANIEQKQPTEEEEDTKGESEGDACGPSKDEYDKMKQRMDLATKELEALKKEHSKLLETYLQGELEEALREKTAGLVVLQAQVQALEESASSRVEELGVRIEELEGLVSEKDSEISHRRFLLEQSQSHAEDLQKKMLNLEEHLREKVAAALVSQATLEAFQQQSVETRQEQDPQKPPEPHVEPQSYEFGDFGIPQMDVSRLGQQTQVPTGKVVHLTQKLRELEVGLSGMQKDQELQKQLLSSSEEEVLEYERRLTVLVDLLSQMKAGTHQRTSLAVEVSTIYHLQLLSSNSEQQHATVTDSFTQTEPLQMSDLSQENKSATKEEMEEVIGEYEEKIVQMQELHAAEILDMEARHISESENLRRDTQALEDECKALKAIIEKLRSAEVRKRDVLDVYSSSDYSQRTGYDLPSLQQEFRTTPEGARRDEPLPDRIKTLLREVHQEGMQVLSLSELPLSESEPGDRFNVQGWVKERDALLDTIESLKNFISQIVDWRGELLDAVRQVFIKERNVLKNALYSQLDLLDTSDAIIHLNQLERRLAEQDAQHREAMGSLRTAERSSLISEIHQLRVHLAENKSFCILYLLNVCLRPSGARSAVSLAGEGSIKEQRERVGADGAGGADRLLVEELKGELSQTKLELETTLKAQHKHLKELDTLRAEVSQKATEVDALNDELTEERRKSRDLQWAMEKEKCRTGRTEESRREELEDLQLSLEEQKNHVAQLKLTVEQERQASSQLSHQAEEERLSLHRRLQELQVQLETERAKAQEMSTALGRERDLRTGVSSDGGHLHEEQVQKDGRSSEERGGLLERLQRELDDKHTQVRCYICFNCLMTPDFKAFYQWLGSDCIMIKHGFPLQVVDLLSQVEAQKLEVVRKEEELTLVSQRFRRDQEALLEAQAKLERLEAEMAKVQEQLRRELENRQSLEEENERLEGRLNQLGEQKEGTGPAVWHSDSTDRTKDWVLQQKSGNLHTESSSASPQKEVSSTGHISSQNQLFASAFTKQHLLSFTRGCDCLSCFPQSASLLAGGSSSSSNTLTERLLRQNAELTGFVSRLTEEKNDLRNHTLRLEEELRRYRQSRDRPDWSKNMDSAGLLLSQEREAWAREKTRLEKALHLAQSQVARLRGEIRSENLREITGPDADNAALKRMYGKYLRSESFRKALIYQKKYLLLLLGGFQECEEATLSLLTRMGGRPSLSSLESLSQRCRGAMRFRSIARVSIALSRMRFLVKRWHRATGMSSTASCAVSKNGTGQILGNQSIEHSRGRSGRESPRSAVSSTHHRFHMSGDHGPLTCSHLQNYDPDRALTDYISRLEALQRRLGSVTSGNTSSPAHMHYMRSSYSFLHHLKFYWRKTLLSICEIYMITNLVMSAYSTVRVCPVKLRSSELTYSDCCTQSKRCEIAACVKV
uniref:A kinase (PRKA) anchor protein 9 n=1 Tax=Neolamprologus brichardi TaxID=32507 RepID=A0A3Q4H9L3_NEOBR